MSVIPVHIVTSSYPLGEGKYFKDSREAPYTEKPGVENDLESSEEESGENESLLNRANKKGAKRP